MLREQDERRVEVFREQIAREPELRDRQMEAQWVHLQTLTELVARSL